MYDSIYARKANWTILDKIEEKIVQDAQVSSLKSCGILSKADLVRYKTLLKSYGVHSKSNYVDKVLLDIGCGFGGVGLWLSRQLGVQLIGLDFSSVAIEYARGKVRQEELRRIRFEARNFTAMELEDLSINAAISVDALYLARHHTAALKEIWRVLKPGAPLLFTIYLEGCNNPQEDVNSNQTAWHSLLRDSGFLVVGYRNISRRWRTYMRRKHEHRWLARQQIVQELGGWGEAELSVSAAMLGMNGQPAFISTVKRFEFVAVRLS